MRSEERQPRSQSEKCSLRLAITDHHLIEIVSDARTGRTDDPVARRYCPRTPPSPDRAPIVPIVLARAVRTLLRGLDRRRTDPSSG